jgi:hypothetical protein
VHRVHSGRIDAVEEPEAAQHLVQLLDVERAGSVDVSAREGSFRLLVVRGILRRRRDRDLRVRGRRREDEIIARSTRRPRGRGVGRSRLARDGATRPPHIAHLRLRLGDDHDFGAGRRRLRRRAATHVRTTINDAPAPFRVRLSLSAPADHRRSRRSRPLCVVSVTPPRAMVAKDAKKPGNKPGGGYIKPKPRSKKKKPAAAGDAAVEPAPAKPTETAEVRAVASRCPPSSRARDDRFSRCRRRRPVPPRPPFADDPPLAGTKGAQAQGERGARGESPAGSRRRRRARV